MRTIALLPFKNEIHNLEAYVYGLTGLVDKIIAVDDGSTDGGVEYLKSQTHIPCDIHASKKERGEDWSVDKIRQQLLDLGREDKGTHFICLDADECFTRNFGKKYKKILTALEPGQKILMKWLAMWKSFDHYREDNSVWSNNFKDFIFKDDDKINFISEAYFCDPRTPGDNSKENNLVLNDKHGAVIHFQFSDWQRFQIKQCWYRCREKVYGKPDQAINQKFAITLDDPNAFVKACSDEWMPKILPKLSYNINIENNWHLQEIRKMFNQYGPGHFEKLNIWHVDQIKGMLNEIK